MSFAMTKIAIMDTGINYNSIDQHLNVCVDGIHDFTGTGIQDNIGHGSNIAAIISKDLDEGYDYCLLILKWFDKKNKFNNMISYEKALKYISSDKSINIVNMSLSGSGFDYNEKLLLTRILENDTIINVAAGNDGANLDKNCNSYPACYDSRLVVIGNIEESGIRNKSSNYGKIIDFWKIGTNITEAGVTMSGTSQSCAVQTNIEIKRRSKKNGKSEQKRR